MQPRACVGARVRRQWLARNATVHTTLRLNGQVVSLDPMGVFM
jgi:hypothetical protein